MGQKINPISLRLQKTNRKYDSSWYSNYHYGELFLFDLKVRDYLERILKQLKYPEGRALISHFSKGSKINLFVFNPTSSRQQKLSAFGLKGAVRLLRGTLAQQVPTLVALRPKRVKQEGQRKLSPVLAKSFEHGNELKRPLKALSSKSKALSIDQEFLLVNQVQSKTSFPCSEKKNSPLSGTSFKQNTNKNGNKWNLFLPYLTLSWYGTTLGCKFISKARISSQKRKKSLIFDEKTHGDVLGAKQDPSLYYLGSQIYKRSERRKTVTYLRSTVQRVTVTVTKTSKAVPSCYGSGTKCVSSDWQNNGSHLVPFFALKDTLNPSYLLKAKRLKDSCFATHTSASLTLCVEQKQQVVSKTLSLWYQRAQGSTHPILVCLGADKKTVSFLTKETSCKAVAKSNPHLGLQSKTCCDAEHVRAKKQEGTRRAQNKLLFQQPVALLRDLPSVDRDPSHGRPKVGHQVAKQVVQQTKENPLRATFEQKQQSFSCHRHENSLYRCHVEGVLDQQTGSSVKLVPFQVSTEKQSALFLAQEVVYFLEKRVSFRKIKDQILKELKNSKIIKGVRITCSGRVGGKSKKAQKAKTETVKQGQTSLGVFSSKIDFAQKSALTSFGLIGVKVWICFY